MGHADPMSFHGMTLSVIIISNITIVVVADFLLAASLTVRHGLPGHRCLRLLLLLLLLLLPPRLRRGEKAGVKVDGGSPAGKGRPEGGEEGGAGRAGYRPAEGPRARTQFIQILNHVEDLK